MRGTGPTLKVHNVILNYFNKYSVAFFMHGPPWPWLMKTECDDIADCVAVGRSDYDVETIGLRVCTCTCR